MSDKPGHHAPLDYHLALLSDPWRVTAWERAIRAVVRPGDVVLDVGTGTGIMAVWAARAGAARVIAVESAWVAGIARATAARNGVADVVEVVQDDLGALAPEPVDVILADFVGRLLPEADLRMAVGAAAAWARPDTRWAPSEVRLHAAPISDASLPALERFQQPLLGVDLSAALPAALASHALVQLPVEALAAPARPLATLHPTALPPRIEVRTTFTLARSGLVQGVAGWFDADLAPGVRLDTVPGRRTFWGQVLWPCPATALAAGDTIELELEARSLPGEIRFAWRITARRQGTVVLDHAGRTDPLSSPPIPEVPPTPLPDTPPSEVGRARLARGSALTAAPELLRAGEAGMDATLLHDLARTLMLLGDPAGHTLWARYQSLPKGE